MSAKKGKDVDTQFASELGGIGAEERLNAGTKNKKFEKALAVQIDRFKEFVPDMNFSVVFSTVKNGLEIAMMGDCDKSKRVQKTLAYVYDEQHDKVTEVAEMINVFNRAKNSYVIDEIEIREDYQNKGIGTAMISQLFAEADYNGVEHVDADVLKDQNGRNLAFYSNLGFKERQDQYDKGKILMTKDM